MIEVAIDTYARSWTRTFATPAGALDWVSRNRPRTRHSIRVRQRGGGQLAAFDA